MGICKQARNQSKIKMAAGFDSDGRLQWPRLSKVQVHRSLFQSRHYQDLPSYPLWSLRRLKNRRNMDQSHVRDIIREVTAEAHDHKHSKKYGSIPDLGVTAAAPANTTTAELRIKQNPLWKWPARQRRSALQAQEYRQKLAALQTSPADDGRGTLQLKETRDFKTQTLCTTLATQKGSTGLEVPPESKDVYEGRDDHYRLTRLEEAHILTAALSHILRHLYSGEDIRWPHPEAVTRMILASNSLPASDLPALKTLVEKAFETRSVELNWDEQSEEFARTYGRADSCPFRQPFTITFSYVTHYIFIIVIVALVVTVYTQPAVL
ncbi:uncharacterized protein LOC126278522 [Schistocerca gregaria]|uniref:uncharacterized protein LOC126278522 n=1 Tax=Schistocerca gregaria TaxID=7010 RepID=UPI00211E0B70|nr:uncharacterized protein LOC126278522 [Schistocerca gregaria]